MLNEPVDLSVLREEWRQKVDQSWRASLYFAMAGDEFLMNAMVLNLEQEIRDKAAAMAPDAAEIFLLMTIEERDKVYQEYRRSPAALKSRLAIPEPEHKSLSLGTHSYANDLAKVAVRTAVRATVWESVRAIFRAFR